MKLTRRIKIKVGNCRMPIGRYVIAARFFHGKIIRVLTDGERALLHPSGRGFIITHPDRKPMWCHADGDVYRQEFIEPITPPPSLPAP